VFIEITLWHGRAVYILFCADRVLARSRRHAMYTLGIRPKFSSVTFIGVTMGSRGSGFSNGLARATSSFEQSL
jgi:hypothetical protein